MNSFNPGILYNLPKAANTRANSATRAPKAAMPIAAGMANGPRPDII